MKKALFALVVLATIVATAPVAMADHCRRCKNFTTCWPATTAGQPFCDDSSGSCVFSGATCTGPHPFVGNVEEPLAATFVVASVVRLDEPRPAPNAETRVASLATAQQNTTQR
jgi:hypothetical protein